MEPLLRERHYTAHQEFARIADSHLRTPAAALWLARLQPEQDNIRAALQWTLDEQRYTDIAWLLIAVDWFWFHNGDWYEKGLWLAQLLPQRMVLDIDLRLAFATLLHPTAIAV